MNTTLDTVIKITVSGTVIWFLHKLNDNLKNINNNLESINENLKKMLMLIQALLAIFGNMVWG
jgi:hypothetical protein